MPNERMTFLRGEDVLSKVRQSLQALGPRLAERRDAERDAGARRVLERVDQERVQILEQTLADFEETAPRAALKRFSQYTVEIPDGLHAPPPNGRSEELVAWMVDFIDRLAALFEQSAAQTQSRDVEETLAPLAELLRGHARRVSRTAYDAFDLSLITPEAERG